MKKNRYNIQIDPPALSAEQIRSHQHFDDLLNQAGAPAGKSTFSLRPPKWVSVLATAAAISGVFLLVWSLVRPLDYAKMEESYFASQPYVAPPLAAADVNFSYFTIDGSKGGSYEHPSGSKLTFPAQAFFDAEDRPITGPVQLRYREYKDFVDFFRAGIPMLYDSLGQKSQLESAGMFTLEAVDPAVRLQKKVEVYLVSSFEGNLDEIKTPFNLYYLNTEQRSWVYEGLPERVVYAAREILQETIEAEGLNMQPAAIDRKTEQEIKQLEEQFRQPKAPAEPRLFNPNWPTLELKLSDPEALENIRPGTLWQILPEGPQLNADLAGLAWTQEKFAPLPDNKYQLTLKSGAQTLELLIVPVLKASEYAAAKAGFDQALNTYNAQLQQRQQQLETAKKALMEQSEAIKATAGKNYQSNLAALQQSGNQAAASQLMIRDKIAHQFQIDVLGTWNCDRPLPPYVMDIVANFKDQNGNFYDYHPAYMVDRKRNTIARFLATPKTKLMLDQTGDNLIWLVTPDNRLAVCRQAGFPDLSTSQKRYTFELEYIDKQIHSETDIREVLGL